MTLGNKLTTARGIRAYLDGRVAGRDGKPLTGCPYKADGGFDQRNFAYLWMRGWRAGKASSRAK